jgi:hypothetical protein
MQPGRGDRHIIETDKATALNAMPIQSDSGASAAR